MLNIPPVYVSLLLGPALVPIITAVLTYVKANARVKVAVNAIVSILVTLVANAVIPETGAAVISWDQIVLAFTTFVTSSVGYDNFWKPLLDINSRKAMLPESGIGKASAEQFAKAA